MRFTRMAQPEKVVDYPTPEKCVCPVCGQRHFKAKEHPADKVMEARARARATAEEAAL